MDRITHACAHTHTHTHTFPVVIGVCFCYACEYKAYPQTTLVMKSCVLTDTVERIKAINTIIKVALLYIYS